MRTGLIALLVLLLAPAAANARGPGSLEQRSLNWGGIAKCTTGYDENFEFVTETCRTIKYCKAHLIRNRRGRVIETRIRWCARSSPWTAPVRRTA